MPVIRAADSRRTETPNAVMTTLASPSQGGAGHALWHVEMDPGASGPLHTFDTEQIWTVLSGAAEIEVDGASQALGPGDSVVLAPHAMRRIAAHAEGGLRAIVTAPAGARVLLPDGSDRGVPAWIA